MTKSSTVKNKKKNWNIVHIKIFIPEIKKKKPADINSIDQSE